MRVIKRKHKHVIIVFLHFREATKHYTTVNNSLTDPERDVFQSPESTHTTRASIHHRARYIRRTFPIQFPSNSNRVDTRSRRPHPRNVHLPHLLAEADADDSLSRPLLSAALSFARRAFAPARVPSSTPATVPSLASLAPSGVASRRRLASYLYRAFGGDIIIIIVVVAVNFVVVVSSSTMFVSSSTDKRRAADDDLLRLLSFPNTYPRSPASSSPAAAASAFRSHRDGRRREDHRTEAGGGEDASRPFALGPSPLLIDE